MKKLLQISLLILSLLLISYVYLKQDFKKTPPTLYTNGHIITLNQNQPFAESMYIEDGKIIEIGTNKQLEKYSSKSKSIIDLKGASVLPGFIDPHTHFSISMFLSKMHDLSGFKHNTNDEVWKDFESYVKKKKKGEWIICKGIDPILIHDLTPPSIEYLDKIAPENPVLFFSQSLHNYWANSKAFELVGINKKTKNPSNQSYYGKDKKGNLNGLIVEQQAVKPFFDILKKEVLTSKKLGIAASQVMSNYAKNGNTTIVSAGITIQDEKPLILFKHLSNYKPELLGSFLEKIGFLPERKQRPRHFMYMRYDMEHLMPKQTKKRNDFYDIIGIKHWYDGSPYTGTMYLKSPYLNTELTNIKMHIPINSKGKALIKKDSLKNFIRKYHLKGWQITIHTQGDAAINEVIDAFEELENELDYSTSRHRLEHCLLFPTENMDRLKRLHLTPSFHINHLYYYGDALKSDILGEQRAEKILPIKTIEENNIKYSLHADQPMFESNPFRLIQTAVERKTISGNILGKNQTTTTIIEAIKSLTINAAWQINMENKIGSLEKGKYADFIILNRNPLKTKPSELSKIECVKTFINGNLAY
ncbi:amidohydrolase [Polaribacter sp. MSW13]|uniref:Amidohydrolase n=1 Tax=Polaribacter marinus TaxID=2916838 RepID=A0A9X1VMZ5_9FLAO|nr:amidohydrolase [Polaribacter marinus]MCI2229101.1 amidohydrolase [Polaribacter marinus]